jgi:hypothetical protein
MKTTIAAMIGLFAITGGAGAAPIAYDVNLSFEASTYYCVGCGGAESLPQTPGGTITGTITLDGDLTGVDRLVAFDFMTFLPQQDPLSVYSPAHSFTFDYDSSDPSMVVTAVGDTFTIHNQSQLVPPPAASPPVGFDVGWNAVLTMTLLGPLGGPSVDAAFGEAVHLQSNAGFDLYSYRWIPRNDRRARNGDTEATLSSASLSLVPLPAGLPLLITGLGILGLQARRRRAA